MKAHHRRRRSIVVGDASERRKIVQENQVMELHEELERQRIALETSKDDAIFAAEIGQSLLQKNELMKERMKQTHDEILERAETAENLVGLMKDKLDQHEVALQKLKTKYESLISGNKYLEEENTMARAVNRGVQKEMIQQKERILRLEEENQSLQDKFGAWNNERVQAKQTETILREKNKSLKKSVNELERILMEKKDEILLLQNNLQESKTKYDRYKAQELKGKENAVSLGNMIEIKQDEVDMLKESLAHMAENNRKLSFEKHQLSSLLQSSRRDAAHFTQLILEDKCCFKNPSDCRHCNGMDSSSIKPSKEKPTRNSLFDEVNRHLKEELEVHTNCSQTTCGDDGKPVDILQEFFYLTASAVKNNGAGLNNGRCNISNESLYAEVLQQNVPFDKYHTWLVQRLM